MAVTSIWRVKGWLGKVVIYVENPEKTTNPEYYQSDAITDRQYQGLEDVISYAVNSDKTQQATEDADIMERYVSGVNCNPSTAREEMLAVNLISSDTFWWMRMGSIGIACVGMIYGGIMLTFDFRNPSWKPGLVLFIAWILSIFVLVAWILSQVAEWLPTIL